jgi:hypothetical protein
MKFMTTSMLVTLGGVSAFQSGFIAQSSRTVVSTIPKATSSLNMVDGESVVADIFRHQWFS